MLTVTAQHDLVVITGLKRPLVRKKQAPGELVAPLPPIDLELHTRSQLQVMDIAQEVDTLERMPQGGEGLGYTIGRGAAGSTLQHDMRRRRPVAS